VEAALAPAPGGTFAAEGNFNTAKATAYETLSVSTGDAFYVKVTAEDDTVGWYRIAIVVGTITEQPGIATPDAGDLDVLVISAGGGEFDTVGLKVFANEDNTEIVISKEMPTTVGKTYTEITDVVIGPKEITVNFAEPLAQGVPVKVEVAVDAQITPVTVSVVPSKKGAITYEVTLSSDGDGNTNAIKIKFKESVTGLTKDNIEITSDVGVAEYGDLTGSGNTWTLAVDSVTTAGNIKVKVVDVAKVTPVEKTVTLVKASVNNDPDSITVTLKDFVDAAVAITSTDEDAITGKVVSVDWGKSVDLTAAVTSPAGATVTGWALDGEPLADNDAILNTITIDTKARELGIKEYRLTVFVEIDDEAYSSEDVTVKVNGPEAL
jgi:hypothetical protein